ncbi:MAG: hypothetical protein DRI61_10955 [Chloroflexi bacterium]|nr:MAG: hypothetical protein DRI61_10955 [Chloroflexota bacterium]
MDSGELLQKIGGRASSEIESYKDLKSYVYDLIACGITGAGLGFFTVGGPMGVACALAALASSGGISLFDILKHRIKYRHIHKVNRKYGSVEEVIKRLSSAYNEAVSYSDSTS